MFTFSSSTRRSLVVAVAAAAGVSGLVPRGTDARASTATGLSRKPVLAPQIVIQQASPPQCAQIVVPPRMPENPQAAPLRQHVIVTSPFGVRSDPVSREARMHRGVDLRSPWGENVRVPVAGLVIQATDLQDGMGNCVRLLHADGRITIYAHLQDCNGSMLLSWLPKGALLGHVGSTGKSTGPHLHFEVRTPTGESVDPLPLLASAGVSWSILPQDPVVLAKVRPASARQTRRQFALAREAAVRQVVLAKAAGRQAPRQLAGAGTASARQAPRQLAQATKASRKSVAVARRPAPARAIVARHAGPTRVLAYARRPASGRSGPSAVRKVAAARAR